MVAAGGLAACGSSGQGSASAAGVRIESSGCAPGWPVPRSGSTTFRVQNRTTEVVDLQLVASGSQRVYAEIRSMAPKITRDISVRLEPGSYSWRCMALSGLITQSTPGTVTGSHVTDATPGYLPLIADDLSDAVGNYRSWVTGGLRTLASETDRLAAVVRSGNLDAARRQWLVAHLQYERLGAVYDTFGDFNTRINGRADGLPGGVKDPNFTGFLRLEYGLWHGQSVAELTRVANQLDSAVHGLVKRFPLQLTPVTDIPLRAHEILENALQFELTGDTDEGSHSNLATVGANVQGTEEVVKVLAPVAAGRDPALTLHARRALANIRKVLGSLRAPDGSALTLQQLSAAQRERLDAAVDAALSVLDQYPAQLEVASGGDQ